MKGILGQYHWAAVVFVRDMVREFGLLGSYEGLRAWTISARHRRPKQGKKEGHA